MRDYVRRVTRIFGPNKVNHPFIALASQVFLTTEVVEDEPRADSRRVRDCPHCRRAEAVRTEQLECRFENAAPCRDVSTIQY
ncbi:hypothetical protein GCM10022382_26050 [Microbacterium invictum]